MRRIGPFLLVLAACGGSDDRLFAGLTGSWAGSFSTDAGAFPVTATFDWDEGDELLTGTVLVEETPGAPNAYAVRRWSAIDDVAYLELTDVADGTRGLDVNGAVDGTFSGDATLRYPCGAETCGWVGTFELQSVAEPLDTGTTAPPPGGTGAR